MFWIKFQFILAHKSNTNPLQSVQKAVNFIFKRIQSSIYKRIIHFYKLHWAALQPKLSNSLLCTQLMAVFLYQHQQMQSNHYHHIGHIVTSTHATQPTSSHVAHQWHIYFSAINIVNAIDTLNMNIFCSIQQTDLSFLNWIISSLFL